jgi:Putative metallopeptidase domain
MPYSADEIFAKRNELPPEKVGKFDELVHAVDHNMLYAKHVLNCSRGEGKGWWLGYRGSLMGTPIITCDPDIPTACVALDPVQGKINYYFNLYFAASLSPGDIAFVMAHECLHLVFGHLEQMQTFNIQYQEIWNVVTDAFINEYLHRSLKWTSGARDRDKLDWTLDHGIRWEDLPPEIQDAHPLDQVKGQIEVTSIQIYHEFLEFLAKEGVDPNQFEEAVEQKRYGRKIKRRKRIEENKRGSGDANESIFEQVFAGAGDLVLVRSHNRYGIIKELRRTKNQKGEADVDCDNAVKKDDYRRLNRAIGVTTMTHQKSYANSRKIVDAYNKLVAAGQALPSWDDLARATGIKEISHLTEIDIAQAAYDEETIMTPEEIEAEEQAKEDALLAKAKSYAAPTAP